MVWVGLALGVSILLLFALPSYRQGEASIAGKTADDFALMIDGKAQHLSDYRGKVVVLNFWASWCPPCVEEAPALNRLQRHLEPLGATILGVSIDEDPDAYKTFLARRHVDFITVRDPSQSAAKLFHTEMWPETYVIDRNGKIRSKYVGATDWSDPEIRAFLKSL